MYRNKNLEFEHAYCCTATIASIIISSVELSSWKQKPAAALIMISIDDYILITSSYSLSFYMETLYLGLV